jgi:hypothetical protein
MLITSYGIDSAILQIVYYHSTNRDDFLTISGRNLKDYLKNNTVNILADLAGYIPDGYLSKFPHVYVLENRKANIEKYFDYPKFLYEEKTSKASIFLNKMNLKLNNSNSILDLADSLASYDYNENTAILENLYQSLGHDSFVFRFIENPQLILTSNEKKLIDLHVAHNESIAKKIVSHSVIQNGILFAKAEFGLPPYMATEFFKEQADEGNTFLVTWNYTPDGEISINIRSRNSTAGDLARYIGGNGFGSTGYLKDKVNFSKIKDMTTYLRNKYTSKIIEYCNLNTHHSTYVRDQEIIEDDTENILDSIPREPSLEEKYVQMVKDRKKSKIEDIKEIDSVEDPVVDTPDTSGVPMSVDEMFDSLDLNNLESMNLEDFEEE